MDLNPHVSWTKKHKQNKTKATGTEGADMDAENKRKISVEKSRMAPIIQDENKYLTSDKGPFFVVMEKEGINVINIGKSLNKFNVRDILDLRPRGKNRVRILFKTATAANNFMNMKINQNDKSTKIYIPNMYIQSIGVISSVPTDISDEELQNNILAECKIIKIERITRWDRENNVAIPTTSVKIWFRQTTLPNNVLLYLANVRVRHFIPNPILCRKCLRYGHTQKFCKDSKETCSNCANKHEGECNNPTNCKYCNTNHKTIDRRCPEYKKQQQIKKIMTLKKVNYRQAIQEIDANSFANHRFTNNNLNKEMEDLKKENDKIKFSLVECQNKLNKIHQVVAQIGNEQGGSNDLILVEIINALRMGREDPVDEGMES